MFVQDFEVKFGLHSELVIHLDNWVRFVTASQTKNLAFDLVPAEFCGRNDRYLFPFELLDYGSTLRLQRIQLGFVHIELPSQFSGFPNLRKLDLHLVRATAKDLKDLLSSCSSLEWLSIVRCHLDDELKVDLPLPRLLYLRVADSMITRIKFNAMNLETFVYRGWRCPIDTRSSDLKDAHIHFFDRISLEDTLTILPTVLSRVKNLNLQVKATLQMPMMLENASKFSQLKYLVLELSFNVFMDPRLCWEPLRSLPPHPHIYLKDLYITGFVASTGQLEFLLHTVDNAPGLEVLTLDPAPKFDKNVGWEYAGQTDLFSQHAREISRKHLSGRISPTAKVCIL
ncbi:unnamed protein product [Urochloa decumbens]|uniref:At1g61320/AtMIF1 LRR domain-containing protein n=1 Tax=Urochloa decumbens TaxID=240449 RepID=A0ABC9DXP9_9POAL